jgi:hypothetical protein
VAASDLAAGAVTPAKLSPGAYSYGAGILTLNTYAVTLSPALPALADGVELWFKADATYLDAAATGIALLNVNALGAHEIKKHKGLNLAINDILSGQIVGVRYDASLGFWQVISTAGNIPLDYVNADTGAVNAFAIAPLPVFTSYAQTLGRLMTFRAAAANTGPSTLSVNGLASPPTIVKRGTVALDAGDIAAGQMVTVIFDGISYQLMSTPSAPVDPVVAVVGASRHLFIQNHSITPSSKITVTAAEVVLKSALGKSLLVSAFDISVDMTVAGTGGLDSGTELASNWYYVWLISDGSNIAGLFSLSATSPTLPANYIYSALVSVVRNNSSSDFAFLWQTDRKVALRPTVIFTAKTGPGSSYTAYSAGAGGTDVDLRTLIPPNAKWLQGTMGGIAGQESSLGIAGDSNGIGENLCVFAPTSAAFLWGSAGNFHIPMATNQTFFWKSLAVTAIYRMSVSGYEF